MGAALSSFVLQFGDILEGSVIHYLCELLDMGTFNPHFFRRVVHPLLYGLYLAAFDFRGLAGRLVGVTFVQLAFDASLDEINMLLWDPYEQALLSDQNYNFFDLEGYWS